MFIQIILVSSGQTTYYAQFQSSRLHLSVYSKILLYILILLKMHDNYLIYKYFSHTILDIEVISMKNADFYEIMLFNYIID